MGKSIELFIVKSDLKLEYQSFCKIAINLVEKCFTTKPYNGDLQTLNVPFFFHFCFIKNLLIIFETKKDEKTNYIAVLKFVSEDLTKKVLIVLEEKVLLVDDKNVEQCVVEFLALIFGINDDASFCGTTKTLFHNLFEALNEESKKKITELFKDKKLANFFINIDETPSASETKINSRKRKRFPQNKNKQRETSQSSDGSENDSHHNFSSSESDNEKELLPLKRGKHVNWQRIKKPNYEILQREDKGGKRDWIIVFDKNNKNLCHEFFYDRWRNYFMCAGCNTGDPSLIRKSGKRNYRQVGAHLHNKGKINEYLEISDNPHICEMRQYNPDKLIKFTKILEKDEFELKTIIKNGISRQRLFIFDSQNKNLGYSYYFNSQLQWFVCSGCSEKGKIVDAKVIKNKDGLEEVQLSYKDHICELREYKEPESDKNIILEASKFEYMPIANGKPKIFVFTNEEKTFGYEFSKSSKGDNIYTCLGCVKNKNGSFAVARVDLFKKDKSDEFYLQVKNEKHSCKPRNYEPQKYEPTIVKASNFLYFKQKSKNGENLKMAIFCDETKTKCYKYGYHQSTKSFSCINCMTNAKKSVKTKVFKDKNGEEYLRLSKTKHICKPMNYDSLLKSGIKILKNSGLKIEELQKTKMSQISEEKIIRLPNFELRANKDGLPDRQLIIFPNFDDKSQCYYYFYDSYGKNFVCSRCRKQGGIKVTARLCKSEKSLEDEENFIKISNNSYICKLQPYQPPPKDKSFNFSVIPGNNEDIKTKVLVFTSKTREACYQYSYNNASKRYQCYSCYTNRKMVTIQLCNDENENGKQFVQFGRLDHHCKPWQYDNVNEKVLKKK